MKMDAQQKKRLMWQLPFLTLLIVGTILIIRQQQTMPYQKNSGFVFGTVYNISYQDVQNYEDGIKEELQKVDRALSMFNASSVISRINQGEHYIPNTEEGDMFLEVYQLAEQISLDTDGAFDITVAPLVNAWGFGFKADETPTKQVIDSIRQFVGYKKQSYFTEHGGRGISKSDPRMMFDCSAIAKGYGADVVARYLERHGVQNYMVEIGGEVVTRGLNPNRLPWRIGVTKPTDDSLSTDHELQTVLNVTDIAMATSGNYRNFYYKDGKKYAHTIDPKTGYPVQHNILSATLLTKKGCAIADAYATSFMVMGLERSRQLLERHPELMAYLIYDDGKGGNGVWFSPSLRPKIQE